MSKNGWILLHRKLYNNWVWKDKPFSKGQAWIDILMMVNHSDEKILFNKELVEVKRGQRVTSEVKLSDRWGWSRTKVRNFLETLEKENMIKVDKKNKRRTRLEVCNYNEYQAPEEIKKQQKNNRKTTEKQQKNTNKECKRTIKNDKEKLYTQEIEDILNCWNNLLSDVHKPTGTKRQREAIITKLKKWNKEKIIKAIKNYNEIYRSGYYYNHNWTMFKFIKQGNGAPRFLPGLDQEEDGDIWKDYQSSDYVMPESVSKEEVAKHIEDIR